MGNKKRHLFFVLTLLAVVMMACSKDDDTKIKTTQNKPTSAGSTALVHTSFLYQPAEGQGHLGSNNDFSLVVNMIDKDSISVDVTSWDSENALLYSVQHYVGTYSFNKDKGKGVLRFNRSSYDYIVNEEGLVFTFNDQKITAVPVNYAVSNRVNDMLPNTFWRIDTNHEESPIFDARMLSTSVVYLLFNETGDTNTFTLKNSYMPEEMRLTFPKGISQPIAYSFGSCSYYNKNYGNMTFSGSDVYAAAASTMMSDIRYVAVDQRHLILHITFSDVAVASMGLSSAEVYIPMVRSNRITEEEAEADQPVGDADVLNASYTIKGSSVLSGSFRFTSENVGTFSLRLSFYTKEISGVFTYEVDGTTVVITPQGKNDTYLKYILVDGSITATASTDSYTLTFPAMGGTVTAYRDI